MAAAKPKAANKKRQPYSAEKVDSTMEAALVGENVDKLLANLSDYERKLFYQLLEELRRGKGSELHDLWKVDYSMAPPSMQTFIDDPYWLGSILKPSEESRGLFPIWRETLLRDFDIDSRIHNVVITGSLGIGKCQAPDTEALMKDGSIKKAKDIRVGDQLMGDDSRARTITKIWTGRALLYSITPLRPKRSRELRVTGNHTLVLRHSDGRTLEITVEDYLARRTALGRWKLYRVPVTYPPRQVAIDPYILGLWLGDGESRRLAFAVSSKDESELGPVLTQFSELHGLVVRRTPSNTRETCFCWDLRASPTAHAHQIHEHLDTYGIRNSRGEVTRKRLPVDYLFNTREVRQQVLAGLIDSDGCKCCPGTYDFALANKPLATDLQRLAESLGYQVYHTYKAAHCQSGDFASWRVTISGAYDLNGYLKLRRKHSPPRPAKTRRSTSCTGFRIKKGRVGDYIGFSLDGNQRWLMPDGMVMHNSYVMVVILLYRVVLARLLRNPQQFFGLGKGSPILYVLLSLTRAVVSETVFGDAQNFMANSPFFLEECGFDPDSKHTAQKIHLGRKVWLTAGSKGWHVIGRNTMGVCLDEGNWRLESNPDQRAYKLYDEIRTRIKNRFMKVGGYLPAIGILASSAKDETAFTEQVITDIQAVNDPNTEKVYRLASYEARRGELKLSPEWFKVAYGLKSMDPRILSGLYAEDGSKLEGQKHEDIPAGASVKLVPLNYVDSFKRNPTTALQSICGVSTGGSHRLFGSTEGLERAVILGEAAGLRNPCQRGLLPLSTEDNVQLWDYLDHGAFVAKRAGSFQPLRDPEQLRFAHLDMATQNVAGLAICHPVGRQLVQNLYDPAKQALFSEYRLLVEYDFILGLTAGQSKPISFEKVQNFILWLRERCGFRFGGITADTWQSVMPLQMLETRGFKTGLLSLDRTKGPYFAWRTGFEESRIRVYRHLGLLREAEQLLDLPDKVDHPPEERGGSKDLTDAAAGAYFGCITNGGASVPSANQVAPSLYGGGDEEVQAEVKMPMMPNVPGLRIPEGEV